MKIKSFLETSDGAGNRLCSERTKLRISAPLKGTVSCLSVRIWGKATVHPQMLLQL